MEDAGARQHGPSRNRSVAQCEKNDIHEGRRRIFEQALATMLKLVTPKATTSQAFGVQATQWSKAITLPSLTLPSSRLTAMSEIGYIMSLVEDAADLGIQTAFKPSTHSKKDLKFKVVAVVESE